MALAGRKFRDSMVPNTLQPASDVAVRARAMEQVDLADEAGEHHVLLRAISSFSSETRTSLVGVPTGSTLRWIIPTVRRLAAPVLRDWTPYKRWSRAKWLLLRAAIWTLGPSRTPFLTQLGRPLTVDRSPLFDLVPSLAGLVPIVYVGTPGPQRKIVCHMVDYDGITRAVIKVPIGDSAREAVKRELRNLLQLAAELPNVCAPRALHANVIDGSTAQTAVSGRL